MGRRPNQLVLQLFDRGEKLPDASNRYRHTCRRCGDVFPKGRMEALIGHVIHHCPNISQHDRETVLLYVQQNPSSNPAGTGSKPKKSKTSKAALHLEDQRHLDQTTLVPGSHPGAIDLNSFVADQSALDTLAEVSRRHLDLSNERYPFQIQGASPQFDQDNMLEQALISELSRPVTQTPRLAFTNVNVNHGGFVIGLPAYPPAAQLTAATASSGEQPDRAQPSLVDPRLANDSTVGMNPAAEHDDVDWQQSTRRPPQSGASSAMASASSAMHQTPLYQRQRPRPRGKFSDIRRKEVQGMRKQGACLRCRMLKKPCSDGTPCNTCANIEAARLWKGNCIRTKLVDEFTLWSTRLFEIQSTTQVAAAIDSQSGRPYAGSVHVELPLGERTTVSFAATEYISPSTNLSMNESSEHPDILLLLCNDNAVIESLQHAVHSARPPEADDASQTLNATLRHASMLAEVERLSNPSTSSPKSNGRSCYNLQQHLVTNTLGLWSATNALCAAADAFRVIVIGTDTDQEPNATISDDERGTTKTIVATSTTFRLITGQVKTALESICSTLSRSVITELERRLLQRQQASGFGTFISAVLLVNSIERLTGLYRGWDAGSTFQPCNEIQHWPFDMPPSIFWPQGQHFTDLLIMLLQMRGLPPKPMVTRSGELVFGPDEVRSDAATVPPIQRDLKTHPPTIAEWAADCKLDVMQLLSVIETTTPAEGASLGDWVLRFVSRLLLPPDS